MNIAVIVLFLSERNSASCAHVQASVNICCIDSFLQYEYFNAVLINEVDEMGNNVELGGEFLLEPNDHFNNLSVNLSLSVVQVPTNMYNKGESAACIRPARRITQVLFNYCELMNGEEKRREESKR